MKITKYLHSCLVVEEQNTTILIDPGVFTYQEKALSVHALNKIDYILITHEHTDHLFMPFVMEIVGKFPDIKIISNESVAKLLEKESIKASTLETDNFKMEEAVHEKIWDSAPPQNTVYKIFDKLIHPGDSVHFSSTADVLALPITAPWGSTTNAVQKALEVKPKVIIPIHDWMWKDEVRQQMYQRLEKFFPQYDIQFKGLEAGETVEV